MAPVRSPIGSHRPEPAHARETPAAQLLHSIGPAALSWAVWVALVIAFALWTHATYHPPTAPAWAGMTIRSGAFAAWALLFREWFALRLGARQASQR